MLVRPQSANARRSLAISRLTSLEEKSRSGSTRNCRVLPSEQPRPALPGPGAPGRSTAALTARRPAHHGPAPSRAVLVEDLLGGQQDPKALQPLVDAHIYLRLINGFQKYDLIMCTSHIVDLCALYDHVLQGGSGRTVRCTRDDLRTMVRRVVVPSLLTTSSVPNKAHRRFRRFQVFIPTHPISYPLTFILYVCYH